jgi:hypothetical protein
LCIHYHIGVRLCSDYGQSSLEFVSSKETVRNEAKMKELVDLGAYELLPLCRISLRIFYRMTHVLGGPLDHARSTP